jgi:hypothetical protein
VLWPGSHGHSVSQGPVPDSLERFRRALPAGSPKAAVTTHAITSIRAAVARADDMLAFVHIQSALS